MSRNTQKQGQTENVGDGLNLKKHDENGHNESQGEFRESQFEKEILIDWINGHLKKVDSFVVDLFEELRDGRNLIFLLEVLTNKSIPRNSGRLRSHMIRNVQSSLKFLESSEKMDISNISAEEVVTGSPNVIISLISRMKLHFRHSEKRSLKISDTLIDLDQRNGHGYGKLSADHGSKQLMNSKKNSQSASYKVKTSIPRSVTRKSNPELPQLRDQVSRVSDSVFDESFWLERMKSIRPLRFPSENGEPRVDPRWCTTEWLPSLLDAREGDSKLIIVDAFVIYLARLTGETNLHIGWNIEGTDADEARLKRQAVLVPIIVPINLNEPWAVVSAVLDDELMLVTRNYKYLLNFMSQNSLLREVQSLRNIWPWQIAITNSERRSQDTTPKSEMLTLDIDARGNFRWIYDSFRLAENVLHEMSEHLRELVKTLLLETNINTPIRKLNVLAKNGGDTEMVMRAGQTKLMEREHHRIRSRTMYNVVKHTGLRISINPITALVKELTPDMLPLIDLTQADINRIISQVSAGLANIQDIYDLSPLQDQILHHHLLSKEGDPYLFMKQLAFPERDQLDNYLLAVQRVVDRHDILRTAFFWEELNVPAQVVLRQVELPVTELKFKSDEATAMEQLKHQYNSRRYRIDLHQALLLRYWIAQETDGRWILHQLAHRLIGDKTSFEIMDAEITAFLTVQEKHLTNPVPFRNFIADARFGSSQEPHLHFFTEMLADVHEPTLSFAVPDVNDRDDFNTESNYVLPCEVHDRLRTTAKHLDISIATLCHLACARVISNVSENKKVVFCTTLHWKMQVDQRFEPGVGLFINTIPFRIDIDETPIYTAVQQIHIGLAQLTKHEHASLTQAQGCSRVSNNVPLFNTLFHYQHKSQKLNSSKITSAVVIYEDLDASNYPLTIGVDDYTSRLCVTVRAVDPIESHRVCAYIGECLKSIVDALELQPDISVGSLNTLPKMERTLMMETWNSPQMKYPTLFCIHQLFEQQAAETPEKIALIHEGQELSYAELNVRANRLAHNLIELGVGPEHIVAICIERSPTLIIGVLGILKAGGAYLPLDPAYSSERLFSILNDASPKFLLADDVGRAALSDTNILAITQLDPKTLPDTKDSNPSVKNLTPKNLAYIIYTSGSTGKPKGVMVEHRNVVRFLDAMETFYHNRRDDVWCLVHSIAFDFSVWELRGALRYGGTLVIAPHDVARSPRDLYQFVCVNNITIINQTPNALKQSIAEYVKKPIRDRLRCLIVGGERYDPSMLRIWFTRRDDDQTELSTVYGPTETTIFATYKLMNRSDAENSFNTIGSRIPDLKIYLLDSNHQPVPMGVTGELYISGPGVTRGYLNRPDLTDERFFADKFSNSTEDRMYKTGDLARYMPDRNLMFFGGNNKQMEIRGFRVELEAIETCLVEHPAVSEAIVVASGGGTDERLVAYFVTEDADVQLQDLRDHMIARLPDHMVPSAYVRINVIPLTINGKLDVAKLPKPDKNALIRRMYESPEGDIEISLANIWSEQLGIERVSRYDSFFELGGHSLLAVRIIESVRTLGLSLTVRDLFEHPVPFELASKIGKRSEIEVPPNVITPEITELTPQMLPLIDLTQADIDQIISQVPGGVANIQDVYALSPLQDGILFHHFLTEQGDTYLLMCQRAFSTRELLDRYLSAVQYVADRHDILRTAFIWKNLSVPAQVILRKATVSSTLVELSLENGTAPDQLAELYDPRHHKINISAAPLLQFFFAQDIDGRWILHELLHHLIIDHTTLEVMAKEIAAFLHHQSETLSTPVPFRHHIANVRFGTSQESHVSFFTEMLQDIVEPRTAFGLISVHHVGLDVNNAHIALPRKLNDRLRNEAKSLGVSLAALFHLVWAQVVARTSGHEKVVFGTVLFGRMHAGEGSDSNMGLFINTLPVRIDVDEVPIAERTRETHSRLARLLEHEHASLALAQRCSSVTSGTPLFNTLLNYRHNSSASKTENIIEGIEFLRYAEKTNYPLTVSINDDKHDLSIVAQVVEPVDPSRLCGYMEQALANLIHALDSTPQMPVRLLEILPETERTLLLRTWNSPVIAQPMQFCLHQLFERNVVAMPHKIALMYRDQTFSYAQLNRRANCLAHKLIELGVGPEKLVAVCVSRSPAMIIALLAILKSGGAYVPLDPSYSSKRMNDILCDASPNVLLADQAGRDEFRNIDVSALTVLDPNTSLTSPDTDPKIQNLTPSNLAYLVYTSGSTGRPKGVMVEHRNAVRLFEASKTWFDCNPDDVWSSIQSIAFDFSIWEIWAPFRNGCTLVVVPYDIVQSPPELYEYLCRYNVTVVSQTTSAFKESLTYYLKNPIQDRFRYFLFGGERFEPRMLSSWFSSRDPGRTKLVHIYGPTEGTVYVTFKILNEQDIRNGLCPIGTRLPDMRVYVLDSNGDPVPIGATGELYISGSGIARGYFNRPELTEERFGVDVFSDCPDNRMYKTGDLVRYSSDRCLLFVGRNDQQIKIRGFRIEPGEVAACLAEYPMVRDVNLLVRGKEPHQRLVAYIIVDNEENLIRNIRHHVAQRLPDYMVPSAFVKVDAFPLTINGKLDAEKLPEPDEDAVVRRTYAPPEGKTEKFLAEIWSKQLGIEQIGRFDSFFELGGHSLLAMRIIKGMRKGGLTLTVRDLFEHPILCKLAVRIVGRSEV